MNHQFKTSIPKLHRVKHWKNDAWQDNVIYPHAFLSIPATPAEILMAVGLLNLKHVTVIVETNDDEILVYSDRENMLETVGVLEHGKNLILEN